jgi:hypothetical protein
LFELGLEDVVEGLHFKAGEVDAQARGTLTVILQQKKSLNEFFSSFENILSVFHGQLLSPFPNILKFN